MNTKTKKMEINVPDNMDSKTAQQAFIFGLRNLTFTYQGGLSVNFATSNGEGVCNYVFYNEEAGAIIDFIDAIQQLNENWNVKKEHLEEIGTEKLSELASQKECSNNCSDCHK